MKFMIGNSIIKKLLIGIVITASILTTAHAVPKFPKPIIIYEEPVIDTIKTTDWYAYPIEVTYQPNNKPQVMEIYVKSSGYQGNFSGLVEIDCKNPSSSFINRDENNHISLKQSMAYENNPWDKNFINRIEREAVEGLFAKFCR